MNRFEINRYFYITNKGYILSGSIVEGEISAGQSIIIDSDTSLKISSVEFVDISIRDKISEIGLLLKIDSNVLIAGLIGQTISITS